MSKITLLLISPDTLARIDLRTGREPKVEQVWMRPTIESDSLGTLVDTALRLGKKRKRNVFVATTRCWNGTVTVAPELIRDTTPEQRTQTIALEAEAFSGISAFDGLLAERALPPTSAGDSRFWVTQISTIDLNELANSIRSAGGRLLGVGHPNVLNIAQPKAADAPWQSLQTWDGTTFAAHGNGGAIADMLTITSGLASNRTRQELEAFFPFRAEGEVSLEWIAAGSLPESLATLPAAQELRPFNMTLERDLSRWAIAWSRLQLAGDAGLPTIAVPKKPVSQEATLVVAAILGLLVMAACAAHYWNLKNQVATFETTIDQGRDESDQLQRDKDQLKVIEEKRDGLVEEAKNAREQASLLKQQLTTATKMLKNRRSRWLKLVDTIVDVGEESSWVNEIRGDDGRVTIAGLAIDDAAVHRFASQISKSLYVEGWNALPANTEVDPETKLVRFEIALKAGSSVRQP